jgi:hypothetical protein
VIWVIDGHFTSNWPILKTHLMGGKT